MLPLLEHRSFPGLSSLALSAVLLVGCSSEAPETTPGPPPIEACNGHAELCDKRFDEVVFPATHNSMSSFEDGWAVPNQDYGMKRQLDDGIRAMLIDTHDWQDGTYLCHSICELGNTPLVEGLATIRAFLDEHPHEVIALLIQDGISAEETAQAFEDSGLVDLVFVHEDGAPWPTLRAMIERGERVLVTAEVGGAPPAWYHHLWDVAWDTPYSFESVDDFTCDPNRGTKGNDLFLLNHWIEAPFATPERGEIANAYDVLGGRAQQCWKEGGQIPNFVAVNFYDLGALFQVVDELNGVASAPQAGP
jgi:hypothetical protein